MEAKVNKGISVDVQLKPGPATPGQQGQWAALWQRLLAGSSSREQQGQGDDTKEGRNEQEEN